MATRTGHPLPLYPSDAEIAVEVLGPERAKKRVVWRRLSKPRLIWIAKQSQFVAGVARQLAVSSPSTPGDDQDAVIPTNRPIAEVASEPKIGRCTLEACLAANLLRLIDESAMCLPEGIA